MKPSEEWTERVQSSTEVGERITDAVEKAGLYTGDPHQLIVGMFLASSVVLMSSYAEATDDEKSLAIKTGLLVEMASEMTDLAFRKIDEKIRELRAGRN